MEPKRTVYILKNLERCPRYYIGVTANLRQRLDAHNEGRCAHTSRHRPWVVDVAIKFADERRALALEKYLKSGSGYSFALRHLR
jgi:putative endonuclease